MASSTEVTEKIEKRLYRNNTAGWMGVVTLDHLGQELGVSVPPGQTIWLSKAEAILTARAPQRPEDNPFEEREFRAINMETGRPVIQKIRPITLVSEASQSMYGSNRYVPGVTDGDNTEKPTIDNTATEREAASQVTAAAAARAAAIEQEALLDGSWTSPEAPGEVLPGSLGGSDEPAHAAPLAGSPAPPPQQPVNPPVTHAEPAEETAALGDETGSLTNGHAEVEGEYGQAEEVGTDKLGPDAG